MIQSGGGAGFPLETLQGLAIGGEPVGQEFQGDGAAQACVLGFVYFPHAARPYERHDLVWAETRSRSEMGHRVID
jgi:hypothetical protein